MTGVRRTVDARWIAAESTFWLTRLAARRRMVVLPTLRARIERVRDVLQGAVARQLAERRVTYLQGTARLGQDRSVWVTSPEGATHQIAARTILIATGSRPTHPPGIPFDDPDIYDSDQIYSLSRVPQAIVIIGGGAVGVEFATIFTALGIPATLVSQSDRLLPSMDGELVGLMGHDVSMAVPAPVMAAAGR